MKSLRSRASVYAIYSAAAVAALTAGPPAARAETFQPTNGSATWNSTANWNPASIPNSVGASAVFNGAATANNAIQSGNRTITLDAAITVGSLTLNTDVSTVTNAIQVGTNGTLTFDATGSGPATISVPAAPGGTGNSSITAGMTLNDTVVATVDNITATSVAGALNLTGTIGGAGGFTKMGDGLATFGTGAKTYTGPTIVNGGRMRISVSAAPTATSSFTVNAGGQLTFTAAAGTVSLGTGSLFLNGSGPTSGPFANGGAIRPDRTTNPADYTIPNPVVLQSDSVIHVQAQGGSQGAGNPIDSVTMSGVVSGPGRLQLTAANSDIDQGTLVLTNANTYAGGTLVAGGIVRVSGLAATLGTGNVTISDATSSGSIARLQIATGVANAIANTATLSIAGGGTAGTADENFIDLGAGINESLSGLILGGMAQTTSGTYGSTASAATFQNNEFFAGTGVVTLIPEPAGLSLLAVGCLGLLTRRRRRRRN